MNILNKLINPIRNFKLNLSAHAKIYLAILVLYIVTSILCAMENQNYHMRYAFSNNKAWIQPVFETYQGNYGNYGNSRQSFPVEFVFPGHLMFFAFLIIVPTLFIDFIYKIGGKIFASVLVLASLVFVVAIIIRQGMRYKEVLSSSHRTKGGYNNAFLEESRKND